MHRRLRLHLRQFRFPPLVWLFAGMYLLVASGVPLPNVVKKDLSHPFPCMYSKCGCRDAEQCWTSCCCHSHAERLAWAKAHGVQPPVGAVVEDSGAAAPKKRCCCDRPDAASQNDASLCGRGTRPHSCCEGKPNRDGDETACSESGDGSATKSDSVAVLAALTCHGTGIEWLAANIARPPAVVSWEYQPQPGRQIDLPALIISVPAFPPPVPPPRGLAIC